MRLSESPLLVLLVIEPDTDVPEIEKLPATLALPDSPLRLIPLPEAENVPLPTSIRPCPLPDAPKSVLACTKIDPSLEMEPDRRADSPRKFEPLAVIVPSEVIVTVPDHLPEAEPDLKV